MTKQQQQQQECGQCEYILQKLGCDHFLFQQQQQKKKRNSIENENENRISNWLQHFDVLQPQKTNHLNFIIYFAK